MQKPLSQKLRLKNPPLLRCGTAEWLPSLSRVAGWCSLHLSQAEGTLRYSFLRIFLKHQSRGNVATRKGTLKAACIKLVQSCSISIILIEGPTGGWEAIWLIQFCDQLFHCGTPEFMRFCGQSQFRLVLCLQSILSDVFLTCSPQIISFDPASGSVVHTYTDGVDNFATEEVTSPPIPAPCTIQDIQAGSHDILGLRFAISLSSRIIHGSIFKHVHLDNFPVLLRALFSEMLCVKRRLAECWKGHEAADTKELCARCI